MLLTPIDKNESNQKFYISLILSYLIMNKFNYILIIYFLITILSISAIPEVEVHQFDSYLQIINENNFAVKFINEFGYNCLNIKIQYYYYDIQVDKGNLTIVTNTKNCINIGNIKTNDDLITIRNSYTEKKYLDWDDVSKANIPWYIKLRASYIIFKMLYLR